MEKIIEKFKLDVEFMEQSGEDMNKCSYGLGDTGIHITGSEAKTIIESYTKLKAALGSCWKDTIKMNLCRLILGI